MRLGVLVGVLVSVLVVGSRCRGDGVSPLATEGTAPDLVVPVGYEGHDR